MFSKLKNALGFGDGQPPSADSSEAHSSAQGNNKVSQWASMQGLSYTEREGGRGYHVEGKIGSKLWRMEQGHPSRDFIKGHELRARAELDVREVAVMVMTRQLKNDLDKRAFAIYTDSLQTTVDASLPEEMRWLAMYEEMGWESLGEAFLNRYAILADKQEHAMAWLTPELAGSLMAWPHFDPRAPQILMLMRGKAYLRMQITHQNDMPTLEHATALFGTACELALANFSTGRAV